MIEIEEIITNLLTLSRKKHKSDDDYKTFQDYVESLSYDKIEDLLTQRIFSSDVPQLVNTIFLGLSHKSASQKKRIKIFEHVLSLLQSMDLQSTNSTALVSWLVVELDKMTATHLVRVCDLCVDYVSKSETAQHTSWKEIIPKVLSLLNGKKDLDHYGTEMSGEEYRSQVITALGQAQWNKNILTSIADMFMNIPLSSEEHNKILSKLLMNLKELSANEVPPLGHNLLLLSKISGIVSVLFALNDYYESHLYNQKDAGGEIETDTKELVESECVMLYHLSQTVERHSVAAAQILKCAKMSVSAPHLWLRPFLLASLLTLSNIPPNGDQVMDLVKCMVLRMFQEEEQLRESNWLRQLDIEPCDVEQVFTRLVKSNVCGQEGVIKGLISLSMCLLGKSKESNSRKIARLGRMIAVNLCIKHPYVAGLLINTLTDKIISSPQVTQYTDCFCELCDTNPLGIIEYNHPIGRLLEELPVMPESAAYRLTSAIVSLFKVSHRIRDSLILVLRKALFAHNIKTRKIAVIGFLQLLKRLKMNGFAAMSQNSFQIYTCPSVFTQSCIEVHSQSNSSASINNEGLCLEVINILKRCFGQQIEVKLCLYEGINRALMHNPELCLPASDIFLAHLRQYYEPDVTVVPPLRISDAVTISGGQVVINEPLGHLVFVVQQMIVTSDKVMATSIEDEDYGNNRKKLFDIMDSLVDRFSKCSPKNLELEEEFDGSLEGCLKEEILKQGLGIFEALIAYFLWKWNVSITIEKAGSFLALYRAHSGLLDFAKNCKIVRKPQDGDKKTQTQGTQGKSGAPKKASPFIPPATVLDFETVHRLLELLLAESVDWCADNVMEDLQGRRALHRYAMGTCFSVLAKTKNQLAHYKPRSAFSNLKELGKLLFEKVMKDMNKLMEFDPSVAVTGVENFTEVFSIIAEYFPSQLPNFLNEACGVEETEGLNNQLERVIKSYLKTLGQILDMDEEEEDLNHRKLMSALIAGVNVVCLQLPVDGTCVQKVVAWLSEVVEKRVISSAVDVKCLLSLLIRLTQRIKSDSALYDNLALHLCQLYGTINDAETEKPDREYAMVTDSTKSIVLPLLCASLSSRLSSFDWLIQRTKAEQSLIFSGQAVTSSPSCKQKIKRKEKEAVVQAGFISSTAQVLTTVKFPSTAELLCKTLHHVYSSLTSLTKYFHGRSTNINPAYQEARFGKLVKLAASYLSSQVADYLLFIESVGSVSGEEQKKISNKVLRQAKKQTVYIPKLVAELENFTKCVTQLSIKCKDPSLTANLKLTTTRDFRLNTKKLEEVMKQQQEGSDDEQNETATTDQTISVGNSQVSDASKKPARRRKRKADQNESAVTDASTSSISQASTASKKQPRKKKKA